MKKLTTSWGILVFQFLKIRVLYEEGNEIPVDYNKAFEFYKKAADAGSAKAKLNIGLMYELVNRFRNF
jgi:TPR repeat protein